MQTAKERILAALDKARSRAGDVEVIDQIAANVRGDVYDEFRSEHPFPLAELAKDFEAAGLGELAKRTEDGDFCASPAEVRDFWDTEGRRRFEALEVEIASRDDSRRPPEED